MIQYIEYQIKLTDEEKENFYNILNLIYIFVSNKKGKICIILSSSCLIKNFSLFYGLLKNSSDLLLEAESSIEAEFLTTTFLVPCHQ